MLSVVEIGQNLRISHLATPDLRQQSGYNFLGRYIEAKFWLSDDDQREDLTNPYGSQRTPAGEMWNKRIFIASCIPGEQDTWIHNYST